MKPMIQQPLVRKLLLTTLAGCLAAAGPRAADLEGYAEEIHRQLVEGRSKTDATELVRDSGLDAIAK
ncbi:MAG: hypothetical protein GWN46_15930, partial [Gammaproteobacteria bacterium]|nr:hypothetical protein [Gammaproteobacteria bacterium]